MKLSHEEVLKIAQLARLELSPEEVEKYSSQLSAILDYVGKLNTLNVEGIEPTAHAVQVPTPLRKDNLVQDKTLPESLKNSPLHEGSFFKVPRVIA